EPIPEFRQPPEEGSKIPSFVRRQDTGDVLPDHPLGPCSASNLKKDQRQVATRVSHSSSETCDRERLARCSSDQKLDCSLIELIPLVKFRHIPKIRNVGIVMREHRRRKRRDLREP